ncbi:hypothetical protein MMC25_002641 [Agyrium rufum]|nr:hypothetical protein [Agyrium rufum]
MTQSSVNWVALKDFLSRNLETVLFLHDRYIGQYGLDHGLDPGRELILYLHVVLAMQTAILAIIRSFLDDKSVFTEYRHSKLIAIRIDLPPLYRCDRFFKPDISRSHINVLEPVIDAIGRQHPRPVIEYDMVFHELDQNDDERNIRRLYRRDCTWDKFLTANNSRAVVEQFRCYLFAPNAESLQENGEGVGVEDDEDEEDGDEDGEEDDDEAENGEEGDDNGDDDRGKDDGHSSQDTEDDDSAIICRWTLMSQPKGDRVDVTSLDVCSMRLLRVAVSMAWKLLEVKGHRLIADHPVDQAVDIMHVTVRQTPAAASLYIANLMISCINAFAPTSSNPFVLGLPTGSSPELIYAYLVCAYRAGKISFRNVVTFNMVAWPFSSAMSSFDPIYLY